MLTTRGFTGKGRPEGQLGARLPRGQYLTTDFPVLTAGPTQRTPLENWSMSLQQDGRMLAEWSWDQFGALPQTELKTDIHCVTKWSKFDTIWRGVSFDDLIRAAGLAMPPTAFVMAHSDGGYTTNVPVTDLADGKAMVATHVDGQPITAAHGGPARLLVPHLYFWKSAKWVRILRFMDTDQAGFWESLGYHIRGDPWREQRYRGDA
jgi:DMSO/TMAO reductase YedYZ molybdopterin-dependent catalytic subunit